MTGITQFSVNIDAAKEVKNLLDRQLRRINLLPRMLQSEWKSEHEKMIDILNCLIRQNREEACRHG